ncbi:MAG: bifunctional diaminohydroxyphosphoribosylaminopyrimidine deaminase/5-amino-6-(5-phosphoribosylamino)uracil reductase RibD [Candidatus Omnitrophota bacterium]
MKKNHSYYMRIALQEAFKARGKTSPNPTVGAVIVNNGRIVAKGYHEKAGLAHAEVVALTQAGEKAKKSTLYVTLEPCTHFGRTPPCVDSIIRSGIKEVVVGMVDPNRCNNGKGIAILKKNNIKVEVGVLEEEVKRANESYIKYITQGMPLVTVKIAQSFDGRIATRTGDSKWITQDRSRAFSHRLRSQYDAIMVGINTLLRDDPKLNSWFSKRQPTRIIIDSRLSTPYSAEIFSHEGKVIIVTIPTTPGQETENRNLLSKKATILEVKEKAGQVNLKDAMKKLAQQEITSILVEGGGTLNGSLFDERLVDKVLIFMSPKIIGGKDAIGSVMGRGVARVEKAIRLKEVRLKKLGEDFLAEAYVQYNV